MSQRIQVARLVTNPTTGLATQRSPERLRTSSPTRTPSSRSTKADTLNSTRRSLLWRMFWLPFPWTYLSPNSPSHLPTIQAANPRTSLQRARRRNLQQSDRPQRPPASPRSTSPARRNEGKAQDLSVTAATNRLLVPPRKTLTGALKVLRLQRLAPRRSRRGSRSVSPLVQFDPSRPLPASRARNRLDQHLPRILTTALSFSRNGLLPARSSELNVPSFKRPAKQVHRNVPSISCRTTGADWIMSKRE